MRCTQQPLQARGVTAAVLDDTCDNFVQIVSMRTGGLQRLSE